MMSVTPEPCPPAAALPPSSPGRGLYRAQGGVSSPTPPWRLQTCPPRAPAGGHMSSGPTASSQSSSCAPCAVPRPGRALDWPRKEGTASALRSPGQRGHPASPAGRGSAAGQHAQQQAPPLPLRSHTSSPCAPGCGTFLRGRGAWNKIPPHFTTCDPNFLEFGFRNVKPSVTRLVLRIIFLGDKKSKAGGPAVQSGRRFGVLGNTTKQKHQLITQTLHHLEKQDRSRTAVKSDSKRIEQEE